MSTKFSSRPRRVLLNISLVLFVLLSGCAEPTQKIVATCGVDWKVLRHALNWHEDSFGDIPTKIQCAQPRYRAEEIACTDPIVVDLLRLDIMMETAQEENAIRMETSHSDITIDAEPIKHCSQIECVCEKFAHFAEADLSYTIPSLNLTSK